MNEQINNLRLLLRQTADVFKQNDKKFNEALEKGSLSPKAIINQLIDKISVNDVTPLNGFKHTNEGHTNQASMVDKRLRDEFAGLNLSSYFETKLNELERLNNINDDNTETEVNALRDQILKDLKNMSNRLTLV